MRVSNDHKSLVIISQWIVEEYEELSAYKDLEIEMEMLRFEAATIPLIVGVLGFEQEGLQETSWENTW